MSDRLAPRYSRREETLHVVTHGVGLVLSGAGLAALVTKAGLHGELWHVVGSAVFGMALVLLYAASTLYHGARSPAAKRFLRRLDHSAIFLLIAGTYTPFMLVSLRGGWGWALLGVVWVLAVGGIVLKATTSSAGRWSVALYLTMGWLVVVAAEPLAHALQPHGVALLVAGGVAYTAGVAFFAWERLPYNHTIWHLFVLAGSALHFSCVFGYVIP
jgi:hemolysin III